MKRPTADLLLVFACLGACSAQSPTGGQDQRRPHRLGIATHATDGDGAPYRIMDHATATSLIPIVNPFLDACELAQDNTPAGVTGLLGAICLVHPRIPGVELVADVHIDHFAAGAARPEHSWMSTVSGKILADGRFDVVSTSPVVSDEGDKATYWQRKTFDGRVLTQVGDASEVGNCYEAGGAAFDQAFRMHAMELQDLFHWLWSPFSIPYFDGIVYEESPPANGRVSVVRRLPEAEGGGIDTGYVIDVSGPVMHIVETHVFDATGTVIETTSFADFASVGEGHWRPRTIKRTTYLDGANGPRTVVSLNIAKATPLTATQLAAVPAGPAPDQIWYFWQ